MFLSTENPPHDPLSSPPSSNLLRLTTSSHELGQSHLSNFSIRDYAYSNRKNNIKNNWPFSTKSFQLLSTHGVTDPLPPFQKFSGNTNQFETTASSSSGKQIVSHETSQGVCSQSKIIENGLFTSASVSKSKVEIVVAAASNNNKIKKCARGGMVKSKEDGCGGLVTASESVMASKTCPICKTFSSASNTTLNAHIDQCLSMDSAVPLASSKPNKPRVNSVDSAVPLVSCKLRKPRVKPLMKVKTLVDIYASAKVCTLEDLDKRNGTQWASVLSCKNRLVADKSQESKKRKASPVGVGPVYIDAKGQKLRILTEFSEEKKSTTTTTTPFREQHEDGSSSEKKFLSQGSKENSKSSRKRGRGKKHGKYIKLISHKANASEVPEYQRGFSGEGSSKGPRRIYNQRMLAKRGLVSKKLYALRDQPSEDDDDEWSGGDHLVLRGIDLSATDSSHLNKKKLRSEVFGSSKTMSESKRAQSCSVRVRMSEKDERSLAGADVNTVHSKKSLASVQEDKYPAGKNVREVTDASPRATSMRNLSTSFVANGWRRLSPLAELKRARLDLSEEEEEETGKWESEMTLSDDDYVSGENGVINEVLRRSSPSFSAYDDDDDEEEEETSEEEEDDNTKRANVLDKTDDMDPEWYQSDTPPSNEIIPSERAMYYSEEVGNMIYGQTACDEDVRFDSEVRGKGSLYVEVDTIPIPGPPGSFLPSPRGMGFDDNLGNSSVITSQFQSSMDQLDRNSSESPVSAVSNFASGRLNFPPELPSSLDIPSSYSTTPMSFCNGTIAEAETMTVDKTIPSRFRNNGHESCCCQRKERISEGVTLNHEASHLLQRRAASSSMAMSLTKSPTRLDPDHPFEQSPYVIQQDLDLHSKFSNRAVVPPSPSNSVLRLMGKDLMVMNQGEADSNEKASQTILKQTPQFHDPQPCAGTGLYLNTSLYLRKSFESSHQHQTPKAQQQTQAQQASPFRKSFDHLRYFSPS